MNKKLATDGSDAVAPQSPGKKRYEPPVLVQWGTLKDVTLSSGSSGNSDGASSRTPYKKTH